MEKKIDDRERLEQLNREYHQISMTEKQVNELKRKIAEAKREKRMHNGIEDAKRKKQINRRKSVYRGWAAAAALAVFILLPNTSAKVAYAMSSIPVIGKLVEAVTFRNYQYESARQNADIQVPEVVLESPAGAADNLTGIDGAHGNSEVEQNLRKSAEEINREIKTITDQIVTEFEKNMDDQAGYQDVMVKSEVLTTTDRYFTLKLICYQGAGSGAEWDYFYTIDLITGQRLALKDLFKEGSNYIAPISENIQAQMREQMQKDEMIHYWVDEADIPEWNFKSITDETSFYLNENGNIVICFNEGDVAPMYMGCVEFIIPDEVVKSIRKEGL